MNNATPSPSQKQELRPCPECECPRCQRTILEEELKVIALLDGFYGHECALQCPSCGKLSDSYPVRAIVDWKKVWPVRRPSPSAPVEEAVKEIEDALSLILEKEADQGADGYRRSDGLQLALEIIRKHSPK